MFIVDIWFSIRVKECATSMELYEQSRREAYKKGRMLWDVVAALPLYRMVLDFQRAPWLRLLRCLKVVNISSYLAKLDRRSVANELNRFRSIWLLYMLLIYWVGCFYLGIAMYSGYGDEWNSWLLSTAVEIANPENPSSSQLTLRLLRELFYATTAFVKKGCTFAPDSSLNFIFSILCSFVGLFVMSFVIGEVASLFISYIGIEVNFRRNHIAVEFYLARLNVSNALKKRAHAFMFSLWSSHAGVSYEAIFQEMPLSIRTACALHISQQPLEWFMSTVFRPLSWSGASELEAFTNAIAQELRFEDYPRDEFVVIEGSISKAMYLVIKGRLALQSNTHKALLKPVGLRSGDFFGERGLLGRAVGTFGVRAIRACDLMSLSSESLLKVANCHAFSRLAFLVAQQSYRKIKAEVTAWCSSVDMERHWGATLHAVLLAFRANTKGRLVRKGSSTLTAHAAEGASDSSSRVKAMERALESPTECYSAFRGFLQLVAPHDPLDWKASFGHSVKLAMAPTEATPQARTSPSALGANAAAVAASGDLAQDGAHGTANDGTGTMSHETPLPRAGPLIDLIPTRSMASASADCGGESAPDSAPVELPPRSPPALDTQRRGSIYSSSKAILQLVEHKDALTQLPGITGNATEDAMRANLEAADAAADATAAARRRNSIECFPEIHATNAHLNDLKEAYGARMCGYVVVERSAAAQVRASAPSKLVVVRAIGLMHEESGMATVISVMLLPLFEGRSPLPRALSLRPAAGSQSSHSDTVAASNGMMPQLQQRADAPSSGSANSRDATGIDHRDLSDVDDAAYGGGWRRSAEALAEAPSLLPVEHAISAVYEEVTRGESKGDKDDALWRLHVSAAYDSSKAPPQALKRARRSEIEKRSRQRRQGVLRRMRDDVRRLECLYAELLDKQHASISEIGAFVTASPADMQIGHARLAVLAQTLVDERSHIKRLLHEHELFCQIVAPGPKPPRIAVLDADFPPSASFGAAFEPLSLEDCYAIVRESHAAICRFEDDSDACVTTGAAFMGWTDRRRFDAATSALQYGFRKAFAHERAESLLLKTWDMFRDARKMAALSFDTSVKMKFEVLQAVSDDVYVIRRDHVHPEMAPLTFLTVHVLFRLQTRAGFTLCFRTIPAPTIQRALEPHEVFFDVFHWSHFNHVYDERGARAGCEVVTGGSIGDPSMLVARHWLFELMISVLRWESSCVTPLFIKL